MGRDGTVGGCGSVMGRAVGMSGVWVGGLMVREGGERGDAK